MGDDRKTFLTLVVIAVVTVAIFITVIVMEVKHSSELDELTNQITETSVSSYTSDKKLVNMIGLRQDYRLQECQRSDFKQSFSDVDYALLGYNILRGYPLAVGHDPGFTYPIFHADYTSGGMTADCRYSVPDGLVVIPDVSCETSFASKTVNNVYEFAKALKVSANAKASGWGASFSASGGYKSSSSEIAKGESVYIISTAKCQYYFSKLIPDASPRFDDTFKQWLFKLHNTQSSSPDFSQIYIEFLDRYGTHFPTQVTFGARYTYEHKMTASEYQKQTESGVNVAVQASYSGLFSIGGGFELDSSQRESASNFAKSVETKTITVGAAPPANGDATTWASEVKTSPVPTAYTLSSIESLFTEQYMKNTDIDYKRIAKNINSHKLKYCRYLQITGQVESCKELAIGITLQHTMMENSKKTLAVASLSVCIETCLEEIDCAAISFCVSCTSGHSMYKRCNMFSGLLRIRAKKTDNPIWQSNIFSDKIQNKTSFANTAIVGVARGFNNDEDNKANLNRCEQLCIEDAYCVAYCHCDCPTRIQKCKLYSEGQIGGLMEENGSQTFFLSSKFYDSPSTSPKP
ncbi:uncharacterized protein LOC123559932 [Mercenaria mercenaria]|uniref:uncharacterized protein LOC123559932 n=1 Tax=Mercenaria mercenaria TaxID=6596 RepID=UPI00234E9ABB|nr:uncharacterized protein LOC123559932 [Mercenaria mercenaria]